MENEYDRSVRQDIAFGGEASELVDAVAAGTANQAHADGQQFRDFRISPSEIQRVNFWRYRKRGYGGKIIEYIQLALPNGEEAQLHDTTSKNQFVSRLGLKISELRRMCQDYYNRETSYVERNALILNACLKRTEPVIFRAVKNDGTWFVYAVVTDKFTEIRHIEVWKIVESEIQTAGLTVESTSDFRTPKRVWKTYTFQSQIGKKVGDIIQVGLRVANSVKGTSSIIFYPFWKRLVCSNGMTSSQGVWKPATTHVGEKLDILQSVRQTLKEALEQAFGYEELMARALQIKIDEQTKFRLLEVVAKRKNFSQNAQYYIRAQLEKEHNTNLWNFVNAITYTATHNTSGTQVSLHLQQIAHSILKGGQEGVEELLAPQPQAVSAPEAGA